jgi:hypothetical protein
MEIVTMTSTNLQLTSEPVVLLTEPLTTPYFPSEILPKDIWYMIYDYLPELLYRPLLDEEHGLYYEARHVSWPYWHAMRLQQQYYKFWCKNTNATQDTHHGHVINPLPHHQNTDNMRF